MFETSSASIPAPGPLAIDSGRSFLSAATGRWAGEQLLRSMANGGEMSPAVLRTQDTLRRDEWIAFDTALGEEVGLRLRGVADLRAAGLTLTIPNAMGKTLLEYENMGDMEDAVVSLDGLARSDNDRVDFSPGNLPLPITHKDFNLGLRTLSASRGPGSRGTPLDTTQIRISGRKVAEMLEKMLFRGGATFGGSTIYGYTNHPSRNTGGFGTNGNWLAGAKTGPNMLADIQTMKAALIADGFPGPYWLYLPGTYSTTLDNDYTTTYTGSIRSRLTQVEGLQKIETVDQMPANNIVMVQATSDVVRWVMGEEIQTIQWDIYGGMAVAFKVMAIQVPLIRATKAGKSGIYHMS